MQIKRLAPVFFVKTGLHCKLTQKKPLKDIWRNQFTA